MRPMAFEQIKTGTHRDIVVSVNGAVNLPLLSAVCRNSCSLNSLCFIAMFALHQSWPQSFVMSLSCLSDLREQFAGDSKS